MENALKHTAWIVDPIDGTVLYANGFSYWGISIGYAEKGVIKEGAIYFPVTHDMFITEGNKVFTAKINPLCNALPNFKDFSAMTKPEMKLNNYDIVVLTQSFAKHATIDIPNPVLVLCCATASFTFTASGKFMSYLGSNIKLWDYAAALAILK
jgi:myo-inositol-1(or 4)-monophosphatase